MKRFLVISLVIACTWCVSAQQKWGITLGVGTVPQVQTWYYNGGSYLIKEVKPLFSLGCNYQLNKNLEVGVYGGYAMLTGSIRDNRYSGYQNGYVNSNAIYYGTEVHYQLLPLFVARPIRFSVYPLAKVGGIYEFWQGYGSNYSKHFFEVGAGVGAAYYFTKHFGLLGEALGGRFYNSWYSWRAGLSFRF